MEHRFAVVSAFDAREGVAALTLTKDTSVQFTVYTDDGVSAKPEKLVNNKATHLGLKIGNARPLRMMHDSGCEFTVTVPAVTAKARILVYRQREILQSQEFDIVKVDN